MQNLKSKIRGLFLGVGIGDSLGLPFEGKSYEEMQKIPFKIDTYLSSSRAARGTCTDDWQLTQAVTKALIDANGVSMEKIAEHHVAAYKETTSGWGGTTRDAIKKISEGIHWSKAGDFQGATNRGFGNGVPMKAAPLAAYFALTRQYGSAHKIIVDFTSMTHQTSIAVSSCFTHVNGIYDCLNSAPEDFDVKKFLNSLVVASEVGKRYYPETIKDNLTEKFESLSRICEIPDLLFNNKYVIDEFGKGTCYVYNSLPFSYAFFCRSPRSIEAMYDVVKAGGDTDTNASFVGALLGALNGADIFPEKLIRDLKAKDKIVELADKFYEKFALQPQK
jgi:poly(ADP-ribose) glycohydrolase ARH3